MTNKSERYPLEIRERAVRMVLEHQDEYRSQWAAITSIAVKFGSTPETLWSWVRRVEVDEGYKPGVTSAVTVKGQGFGAGEPGVETGQ